MSKLKSAMSLIDTDIAAAERELDDAIGTEPESFELRLLRAIVREKRKRPVDAVEDLQVAVRLRPSDQSVALMLAIDLQASGAEQQALKAWQRVCELSPENKDAWARVCVLADKVGERQVSEAAKQVLARL